MAIFVLVHGSWHGGWCWRRVAQRLRTAGHEVFTPTNTGLAERAHLLDERVGLSTFIADVVGVIEAEELTDVVLVGHSFGTLTVLGVADVIPDRLNRLFLLDGALAESGDAPFDGLPPEVVARRIEQAKASSEGLSVPAPPVESFGVSDPNDIAWVTRRLTPHPLRTYIEPLRLRKPLGNGLRCTYLCCTDPLYLPIAASRELAHRQRDWEWREIPTGHDAMITAPELVVAELLGLPRIVHRKNSL